MDDSKLLEKKRNLFIVSFFLLHRRDCIITAYQKYSAAFRTAESVVSPALTDTVMNASASAVSNNENASFLCKYLTL